MTCERAVLGSSSQGRRALFWREAPIRGQPPNCWDGTYTVFAEPGNSVTVPELAGWSREADAGEEEQEEERGADEEQAWLSPHGLDARRGGFVNGCSDEPT